MIRDFDQPVFAVLAALKLQKKVRNLLSTPPNQALKLFKRVCHTFLTRLEKLKNLKKKRFLSLIRKCKEILHSGAFQFFFFHLVRATKSRTKREKSCRSNCKTKFLKLNCLFPWLRKFKNFINQSDKIVLRNFFFLNFRLYELVKTVSKILRCEKLT